VTTPEARPYGKRLALWSLPFWLISILCLVYGLANGLLFTTICGAAAAVSFPFMVWRRWHPPTGQG
jgi:hypothetical protein